MEEEGLCLPHRHLLSTLSSVHTLERALSFLFLPPPIFGRAGKLHTMKKLLLSLLSFLALASLHSSASKRPHTITFTSPSLYPEGFAWDPRYNHFILGSIFSGSLVTVSDAGVSEDLIRDPDYAGQASTLGVIVDLPRRRLLAAFHGFSPSQAPFAGLAAYSLASKARIFLARFDANGTTDDFVAIANDVAVDPAGNAYVTNSAGNFVWKVTLEGEASILTKSPAFSSQTVLIKAGPAAACGLNGIVYDRSHNLLVGQSNSGMLFKITLVDATVRLVHLHKPLLAVDGLALRRDGMLVAVSTHTAWLLRSRDNWMSAEVVDELPLDSSSNTTAVTCRDGDRAYILHSHFQEVLQGKATREVFTIQEIVFPSDRDDPIWLILIIVLFVVLVSAWRFQLNYFFKQYAKKRE